MTKEPTSTVTESLEAMIDQHGLTSVVAGLVLVCGEKAAYIRHNWQDNELARTWDLDANAIDRALHSLRN